MMSVSQVDMVALMEGGGLQVCGDLHLSPMKEGEAAPSSTDLQSVTVAVRQGDAVATLHAAAPFKPATFALHTNGRWELKSPGTGAQFEMGRSAVVSAVIVLKCERAGLETLSWVQPARIAPVWSPAGQPGELHPVVLAQPGERALTIGHSVFSSLAILQDKAGGDMFSGLQRIAKVPPAAHPTP
jgi:hypothetical protein